LEENKLRANHAYPVTKKEQRRITLMRKATLIAAGGSLFILGVLYDLWNDAAAWMWDHWVEGYVPLINLATEG
jgi:hypothetical protein